jgi:hypothetical protein
MTDNTTLDAALQAADTAIGFEGYETTDVHRTYARALIAKLLEGMEPDPDPWGSSYEDALTEIRRRAGLEEKI